MSKIPKIKLAYLELLLESPEGITPSDVAEIYFDDVTVEAANNILRRLKKRGCAKRQRESNGEFRYWITNKGILKLDYLMSQKG